MGRPRAPFGYIFTSELHGRQLWFARLRRIAAAMVAVTALVGPRRALVCESVEMHRGTVFVTGAPGSGTTFTVRLPLDHEPLEVADRTEADAVAG